MPNLNGYFFRSLYVKGLFNFKKTICITLKKKNQLILLLLLSEEANNASSRLLKFLLKFYTKARNNTDAKRNSNKSILI